jgi:hypothetical protein
MKTTVYYAHCVAAYGTPQENRDMETLTSLGFSIYNPNNKKCQTGAKKYGMAFFDPIVKAHDVFAFRALPDGRIPSGVAYEYDVALSAGKLIIELPSNVESRRMTYPQTKEYLKEVGNR